MIAQKVCECGEPVRPEGATDRSPFFFCQRCLRIRKQVVLCLCGCGEPVEFPEYCIRGHAPSVKPKPYSGTPPADKRKVCLCTEPEPRFLVQEGDHFYECRACEGIREVRVLCSCGCGNVVKPPNTELLGHGSRRRRQTVLAERKGNHSPNTLSTPLLVGEPVSLPLCECGCGWPVKVSRITGRPNRYLQGHAGGRIELLCECGCGGVVGYSGGEREWPRFLPGHNLKKAGKKTLSIPLPFRHVFYLSRVSKRCFVRCRDWKLYPWARILYQNSCCGGEEIPVALDIHHRDGDATNDSIDNLVALTREGHSQLHLPLSFVGAGEVSQ